MRKGNFFNRFLKDFRQHLSLIVRNMSVKTFFGKPQLKTFSFQRSQHHFKVLTDLGDFINSGCPATLQNDKKQSDK